MKFERFLHILILILTVQYCAAAATEKINIPPPLSDAYEKPVKRADKEIPAAEQESGNDRKADSITWFDNLEKAMTASVVDYKPVFLLLSSPECPICTKLKESTLKNPELIKELSKFISVEIDVSKDRQIAGTLMLRGVPCMIIVSGGREFERAYGYMGVSDMLEFLKKISEQSSDKKDKKKMDEYLAMIKSETMTQPQWEDMIVFVGKAPAWIKDTLNGQIKKMQLFPAGMLVNLLTHENLHIRLGVLELLEDFSGTDFGFDPWVNDAAAENGEALSKWKEWAEKSKSPKDFQIAAVISKEKCMEFMNDIAFSDSQEKVSRAVKQVSGARTVALPLIDEFLAKNKNSITVARHNEFRILKYKIIIPDKAKMPSETMARRLVTGNPDTKIQSLHELIPYGRPVIGILDEMRQDNNPVIREAVFDVLFKINPQAALRIAEKHLPAEKNKDVIIGIIRNIGTGKLQADSIINTFLASKDEDILLQTLDSIALSGKKYKKTEKNIVELLSSPSWRVRGAALTCIEKLGIKNCSDKIEEILNDPDDFVRHKAISLYPVISPSKSTKKLEEFYFKNDSMKAAVLDVFFKNNLRVSTEMINALQDKDAQIIEQVIQTLEKANKDSLQLVLFLSKSKYPGVVSQTAEFIASKAALGNDWLKAAFDLLKSGNREVQLIVLKSLQTKSPNESPASEKAKADIQQKLTVIIENAKTVSENNDKNISKPFQELVKQYFPEKSDLNPESQRSKTELAKQSPVTIKEVSEYLLKMIRETDSEEIFYYAALLLMDMRNREAINYFIDEFDTFPSARKIEILKRCMASKTQEKAIILIKAIMSSDKETREVAFSSIENINVNVNAWLLEFVLEKILKGELPISIVDITRFSSWLNGFLENKQMENNLKKLAASILTSAGQKKENIVFSLLVYAWHPEKTSEDIAEVIEKSTVSDDQWIRRAAWFAFLKIHPEKFQDSVDKIVEDSSEHVRIIVPLLAQYPKQNDLQWINFYDAQRFFMISDYNWKNKKKQYVKVSQEVKDSLEKLTEDVSVKVRIDAFIALLLNQSKISQEKFEAVLDTLPDQKSVLDRLEETVTDKYQNIDKSMSFVVKYLDDDIDKEKLRKINNYFNISSETQKTTKVAAPEKIEASVKIDFSEKTSEKKTLKSANAETKKTVPIVFFSKTGCKDCQQIRIYLERLKNAFQELDLKEYDMNNRDSVRFNQAYCLKFNVPPDKHMIAPAIFTGSGYLIKDNINFDSLSKSVSRAVLSDADNSWVDIKKEDLENSEIAIREKYDTFTFWLILAAGLLDGINPCAFATIIFFISYLRISRRKTNEIIKTAGAFILGVFLSYYLLGLGFTGIIDALNKFKILSLALNISIALVCLVLAIMSFHDGVLCMRGRMKDMTLQLPEFLKERIRSSIRGTIKSRYIIMAAFSSGVIVSMLELACTGQVYAPAIMVMLNNPEARNSAMIYLVLYNIAFITPLIIATVLTYCGTENQKFGSFLQRHSAGVKFLTALLFLLFMLISAVSIYKTF